jgi:hypothetical protein
MLADQDIVQHGQVGKQTDILEGASYAAAQELVWWQTEQVGGIEVDSAAVGRGHAGDDIEQCRFTGPVRPDHGYYPAGRDGQIDSIQSNQAAVAHGDAFYLQPGVVAAGECA